MTISIKKTKQNRTKFNIHSGLKTYDKLRTKGNSLIQWRVYTSECTCVCHSWMWGGCAAVCLVSALPPTPSSVVWLATAQCPASPRLSGAKSFPCLSLIPCAFWCLHLCSAPRLLSSLDYNIPRREFSLRVPMRPLAPLEWVVWAMQGDWGCLLGQRGDLGWTDRAQPLLLLEGGCVFPLMCL